MSYGKMNTRVRILRSLHGTDEEGFPVGGGEPLYDIRAYKEDRHGTEAWKNRAAYTTATTLFRFRKIPGFVFTNDLYIMCGDERYDIYSWEDVRGRGMYMEVLAERVIPNG